MPIFLCHSPVVNEHLFQEIKEKAKAQISLKIRQELASYTLKNPSVDKYQVS